MMRTDDEEMRDEWKKVPSRSRREDGVLVAMAVAWRTSIECWNGIDRWVREKVPGGEKRMDGFAFRRNDDDDEEEID